MSFFDDQVVKNKSKENFLAFVFFDKPDVFIQCRLPKLFGKEKLPKGRHYAC